MISFEAKFWWFTAGFIGIELNVLLMNTGEDERNHGSAASNITLRQRSFSTAPYDIYSLWHRIYLCSRACQRKARPSFHKRKTQTKREKVCLDKIIQTDFKNIIALIGAIRDAVLPRRK